MEEGQCVRCGSDMKAYCVSCRKKVVAENPKEVMVKGKPMLTGTCGECGTKVFRFLPGKKKRLARLKERK